MEDRVRINNGKSSILKIPSNYDPADFEEFIADLKSGLFADVSPNNSLEEDAGITVVGTPLNKANLLSDDTVLALDMVPAENPTPNDAFAQIAQNFTDADTISTVVLYVAGWAETQTGSGIYAQTVSVPNMKASTNALYDLNLGMGTTSSDAAYIMGQYGRIGKMETGNGTATFYCYGITPSYNIPIKIKGI